MRTLLTIAIALWCALAQGQSIAIPGASVQWFKRASSTPISFGALVQRQPTLTASGTSGVITVSNTIPAGSRAVIMFASNSATGTASSVADSKGNTWTVDAQKAGPNGDAATCFIASSKLATQLVLNDTITITFGASGVTFRGFVVYLNNSAGIDINVNSSAHSSTVTAAGSTTASPNVQVGLVFLNSASITYGSGSWTAIDNFTSAGFYSLYGLQHPNTTTASENPNGTTSSAVDWCVVWVNYK